MAGARFGVLAQQLFPELAGNEVIGIEMNQFAKLCQGLLPLAAFSQPPRQVQAQFVVMRSQREAAPQLAQLRGVGPLTPPCLGFRVRIGATVHRSFFLDDTQPLRRPKDRLQPNLVAVRESHPIAGSGNCVRPCIGPPPEGVPCNFAS
jgi:hypothetical protein